MITLERLREDQYRQVAEWEHGPQPPDTDWERYRAEMNQWRWAHFGLYLQGEFVGALSLERIAEGIVQFHVSTARKKVKSHSLAETFLKVAGFLFRRGFTGLIAKISTERHRRAAAILALRCGMREYGYESGSRLFLFTRTQWMSQVSFKNATA